MRKYLLKIILFTTISVLSNNLTSKSLISDNDSLKRYIDVALKNNPELQGKFNEYKASLENIEVAGTLPDPNLTFGYFLQKMELLEGNQVADIKLMQMFPWFGALKASKNEASQMAKAKYEELRELKQLIINNVETIYYQLYQTEENIKLLKKNAEILNTIKKLALVSFKTADLNQQMTSGSMLPLENDKQQTGNMQGMRSGNGIQQSTMNTNNEQQTTNINNGGLAEILRIQLEINEIDNNISVLKNKEKSLFARFNSYLNRNPAYSISIADTLTADTTNDLRFTIYNLRFDSIIKNNPMLGMINADKQAYDAKIEMSRLMKYPMFGIGVDYGIISKRSDLMSGMNGQDMIMPMVSVSLPIYRRKYNAAIKEATLLRKASENKYNAAINSLQADYIGAIEEYNNGKMKLKFNKNQSGITQISFDLLINNFSASKADMTEILRVQQQLLDYKVKSIEALVEINNALSEIRQIMAN